MSEHTQQKQWFAMRDLSRRNANVMSHQILREVGIEVFTPMKEMLITIRGKRQRRKLPVIQDLLFVHESKETLDPFVARIPNLQYRYAYGRKASQPTIVNDADMERFIMAIGDSRSVRYYLPDEIEPSMYGKRIRIEGGSLDKLEGHLLSVKGMRTKRLIVQIPNFLSAAVEVEREYITFI